MVVLARAALYVLKWVMAMNHIGRERSHSQMKKQFSVGEEESSFEQKIRIVRDRGMAFTIRELMLVLALFSVVGFIFASSRRITAIGCG